MASAEHTRDEPRIQPLECSGHVVRHHHTCALDSHAVVTNGKAEGICTHCLAASSNQMLPPCASMSAPDVSFHRCPDVMMRALSLAWLLLLLCRLCALWPRAATVNNCSERNEMSADSHMVLCCWMVPERARSMAAQLCNTLETAGPLRRSVCPATRWLAQGLRRMEMQSWLGSWLLHCGRTRNGECLSWLWASCTAAEHERK
jgi:hypothetical protein